jgi:hypothetical protein
LSFPKGICFFTYFSHRHPDPELVEGKGPASVIAFVVAFAFNLHIPQGVHMHDTDWIAAVNAIQGMVITLWTVYLALVAAIMSLIVADRPALSRSV